MGLYVCRCRRLWRPTSRTRPTHYPSRAIFASNSYSFCDQENPYTSYCTYRWQLYGSAFLADETHCVVSVWIWLVWVVWQSLFLWAYGHATRFATLNATLTIQQFVVILTLLFAHCIVACVLRTVHTAVLLLWFCTFVYTVYIVYFHV